MAGGFVYIEYTGDDAGQVLTHLVASGTAKYDTEEHDLTQEETPDTRKIMVGFQPNPDPEEEDDGEGDDGPDDHQRGPLTG